MNRYWIAALAVCAAIFLGACGGSTEEIADSDTLTEEATTTSTSTTTTTTTQAPETTVAEVVEDVDWSTRAQHLRERVGEKFRFDCPADGSTARIWGVEMYTDDSSVCSAAVHVGLLTPESGGTVVIEMAAGKETYEAGTANDISSEAWPSWGGSFFFPDAPPGTGDFVIATTTTTTAPETTTADAEAAESGWSVEVPLGTEPGTLIEVNCEAGGELSSVWGSGPYTAEASICSAAVHAGVITVEAGGSVTATVTAGEEFYTGSTANGVISSDWPEYDTSFTVS